MRKINKQYKPVFEPIADLDTYRAIPTDKIQQIDPFLFLNHHGPQTYPPNNNGLPFGPHPHRGFETLTYIFSGDIVHEDTGGFKSKIGAGGIQWMTAGSGLLHSERSSDEFKKKGGEVEVIQLWMNLPARLKMIKPEYHGLQKSDIPQIDMDNGRVKINLISGEWGVQKGPVNSLTGLTMTSIEFKAGGSINLNVDIGHNILFYIKALKDSLILFGHGQPLNEPVIAQGPFVMNSKEEITQAIRDYQSGKMGVWH